MIDPGPTLYSRTQRVPRPVLWGFSGALLLFAIGGTVLAYEHEGRDALFVALAMVPALLVVAWALTAFHALRVEVREGELTVAFGGLGPRRRIDLSSVRGVRPTRTSWLNGWGIRWIPGGWLWNVWGFDAVELELANGRRFLVGTADPRGLVEALERAAHLTRQR